jgi:hypothetical protein
MAKRPTPRDQRLEVQTTLREKRQTTRGADLKALLSSAPLEGIDLGREQGMQRDVDLDVNSLRNTFRVRKEPGSSSSPGG